MDVHSEVAITLRGGLTIDTWSEYRLTLDMLKPGSAWTFKLYQSDVRQSTWSVLQASARLGEQLYLWIDHAVQLSGRIETVVEEADRKGTYMTLTGRDLAGPLIDWDADPTIQLRGSELIDAMVALVAPYGISLFPCEAAYAARCHALRHQRRSMARHRRRSTAHHIDVFKIKTGDRVWHVADTLCRKAGFLLWTAPHPDQDLGIGIILDKPIDTGDPSYALYRTANGAGGYDTNVLASTYERQIREIPTEVVAFTHSALNSEGDTRVRATVFNDALASSPYCVPDLIPQPRFLTPERSRTPRHAAQNARRTIAEAMAGFRSYEARVQGHFQHVHGEDRIWAVNTLCRVNDEKHSLDEDMLITRVHFEGGRDEGQTTTIRCVPKGAIQVFPEG